MGRDGIRDEDRTGDKECAPAPARIQGFHFGPDGIKPVEGLGKHGPVIVGNLLAIWQTEGQEYPKYLIDGMEGGMTPIGTFEKEVGAAAFRDGTLLIATQEYIDARLANSVVDDGDL